MCSGVYMQFATLLTIIDFRWKILLVPNWFDGTSSIGNFLYNQKVYVYVYIYVT